MNNSNNLAAMHQQMIAQSRAETNAELASEMAEAQAENIKAQQLASDDFSSFSLAGLDTKALAELELKTSTADDQEFNEIDFLMTQESTSPMVEGQLDLDSSLLPEGAILLTPSWSETFSDSQDNSDQAQSSEVSSQTFIGGGSCKNVWNWAKGGGSGCGGGVGSNTQIAKWGFWFKPTQSRYHSFKPRFDFNGYYIVKANDKWYNCKRAKLQVSMRTQVHQYNWKHRSSENILYFNSKNININRRLDDRRTTNYSVLLGKDDWVYVECSVRFYVRAQGSGSYAKNDFSVGANKVCVPYVIVV